METLRRQPLIFKALSGFIVLLNLLLGLPLLVQSQAGINLPDGFSSSFVAGPFTSPTGMAIAPDGRLFIIQQDGVVRIVSGGALLPIHFVDFNVDSTGERGLLGIAFDPSFSTNNYIYFYYTVTTSPVHNRVVRVTANGNVMQPGSEVLVYQLDDLTPNQSYHNGGALSFSPTDGRNLYIATGENYTQSNAQSLTSMLGKILRITVNTDGTVTIPSDNPFNDGAGENKDAIWALGLRNPFVIAFQPGTGLLFINDVGEWLWEEINDGIAGSNYGWPMTEGPTTNSSFRTSLCAYPHPSSSDLLSSAPCGVTPQTTPVLGCAITGGAFYNPASPMFPSDFIGDYLFNDLCNNWIKRYDLASDTVIDFASNIGSESVDIEVAADGSIYYLIRGNSSTEGALYRITYNGSGNLPPTITQPPSDGTVAEGETAQFSCAASGTAPLSYQWQRKYSGEGSFSNISDATSTTYTIPSTVAATDNQAQFRCSVTNAYGSVNSNTATLTVQVNQRPTATIIEPTSGALFSGGQVMAFSGMGTDPEDGIIPASGFTWEIELHHTPVGESEHIHPAMLPVTGITASTFTISNDHGDNNHFYRVILTITDSQALTQRVSRDVYPQVTTISIQTQPPGLQVSIDGQPRTTPLSYEWVINVTRSLGAITPQTFNDSTYVFQSWSDGGTSAHTVTVPSTSTTYTVTYLQQQNSPAPTDTATSTPTATQTNIPSSTPTPTATFTPTNTPTSMDIPTDTPTSIVPIPLNTPALIAPANGLTTINHQLIFSWTAVTGAVRYQIRWDSTYPQTTTIIDTTETSYTPSYPLSPGTYYWRVRAFNAAGQPSEWSEAWNVTILLLLNAAPQHNYSAITTPRLTWNRVTYATAYEIQVDNTSSFSTPLNFTTVVLSNTLEVTTTFLPNGTYYWRVRARQPDGTWGTWSTMDTFMVDVPS